MANMLQLIIVAGDFLPLPAEKVFYCLNIEH